MFFSPRPFKKCPIGSHSVWPDWIINERFWQQVFVTKVAQKCKILGSFFEKRHFSVKTVEVTIGATFQKIGLLSISTTWSHCIHPSTHPSTKDVQFLLSKFMQKFVARGRKKIGNYFRAEMKIGHDLEIGTRRLPISVTGFGENSPLWQRFTSIWQNF